MKLSIAIVGLPNVGKSTLFKLLTKQEVNIANYPFATIDPNVGVVAVPDERLEKLNELSKSKKKIPAVVEFYDIAGLVKGANKGEGLGNQFLTHIRDTQAIVVVLRAFKDERIIHVENSIDALRDFEIINAELALKDLETVEKRLGKLEGEARSASSGQARTGDKKAVKNLEVLTAVKEKLNKGESLVSFAHEEIVHEIQLLTAKKRLYLINGDTSEVPSALIEVIERFGADYLTANLAQENSVGELIKKSYEILGLISFFTTGEDETRAWTIVRGTQAPEAAGVIHTDFETKFIRAEVIGCNELIANSSWQIAKQKGLIRIEGKDYVMKDGDVIVIRHG